MIEGIENYVRNVADTKLEAIIALQLVTLDLFAVYESPVLASLVNDEKLSVFGGDQRVIARHSRIGDDQVLIDFSANGKRAMCQVDRALFVALYKHQGWKQS